MNDLCLLHRRVAGAHDAWSGALVEGSLADAGAKDLEQFESSTFASMIAKLAEHARRDPGARLVMQRTDRPGLRPHTLDPASAALLRTDTAAFVASMSVVVHVPDDRPRAPLPPILVVGHDALADAFGDQLYVRRRQRQTMDEVECPMCGRWVPLKSAEGWSWFDHCAYTISIETSLLDDRWLPIYAEALLSTNAPKFFFPRAWNEGRNWITHETLKNKYATYLQEKNAS
jgi:hypothetical protein